LAFPGSSAALWPDTQRNDPDFQKLISEPEPVTIYK
jgi:hypothetical protein